jgi:ABC-type glycerol-3-phosphate transport system permease component
MATAEITKSTSSASAARYTVGRRASRLVLYVLAIGLALLFCLPFFWTITSSLKSQSELYTYPPTLLPEDVR